MLRPLAVKHENRVAGSADRFTLGAMLLFEAVDGNDVPRAILSEIANPFDVRGFSCEAIREVDDFIYACGKRR